MFEIYLFIIKFDNLKKKETNKIPNSVANSKRKVPNQKSNEKVQKHEQITDTFLT